MGAAALMVVDTSAIIAIFLAEEDAARMAATLEAALNPRISAGSVLETSIVLRARTTWRDADQDLDAFIVNTRLEVEPVTLLQLASARDAHRRFGRGSGHPARLNFGDCLAYALAKERGLPLLFKGDDFSHTDIRPALPHS